MLISQNVIQKIFVHVLPITQMNGTVTTYEVSNYPGMPCWPFTWEESVDKFDCLTKGYINPVLAEKLTKVVKDIEIRSIKDLVDILTGIKYPTTNK